MHYCPRLIRQRGVFLRTILVFLVPFWWLGFFSYTSVGIGLYCSCQVILYTSLVFLLRPEEFGRIGVVPVFRVPAAEIRIPILEFGSGRLASGPYDFSPGPCVSV